MRELVSCCPMGSQLGRRIPSTLKPHRLHQIPFSHGRLALVNAYAPNSGYSFDSRQSFFKDLGSAFRRTSVNGMKLVCCELNARIQKQLPGEDTYFCKYVLGRQNADLDSGSNRELLLEFCAANEMYVANTFFDHAPEHQATFRNVGTPPGSVISSSSYTTLDFVLARRTDHERITDIQSHVDEPLASHHFAVVAKLSESLASNVRNTTASVRKKDCSALRSPEVARFFVESFEAAISGLRKEAVDIEEDSQSIEKAFALAEKVALTDIPLKRNKPRTIERTLALIDQRSMARDSGDAGMEIG